MLFLKHNYALDNIFEVACKNVIKYTEIMKWNTKWNYFYLSVLVLLLIDFESILGCNISKTAFSVVLEYQNVTSHTKFTFLSKTTISFTQKRTVAFRKSIFHSALWCVFLMSVFINCRMKRRHMIWQNHLISKYIVNVTFLKI